MSFFDADIAAEADSQPRARGCMALSSKRTAQGSAIATLRTSGSMKALFPVVPGALEAIMINTSGGVTGGDRFYIDLRVGAGSTLVVTTQAAERAYRSAGGTAQVTTRVTVADNGFLCWLPQELIVFNRSALERRLTIDMASSARLLMVEPIIFGRSAMGERLDHICLDDRIEVTCANQPLYCDHMRIQGDAEAHLSGHATARGAKAMVSVVYKAADAEARLDAVRALLPDTGGASLLTDATLVMRMLASDGFELRRSLIPILETLKGSALPRSWSL